MNDFFKRAGICFVVILAVILMMFLGVWFFDRKKTPCFVMSNTYPNTNGNVEMVKCGYVSTDLGNITSRYFGKFKNVYNKDGKVYIDLNFGSDVESVFLGNLDKNDLISLTLVPVGYKRNKYNLNALVPEKIKLDNLGIEDLKKYIGKNILLFTFLGTEQSGKFVDEVTLNSSDDNKILMEQKLAFAKKCAWYEDGLKKYLSNKKNVLDFWRFKLSKLSDCRLLGLSIYVYQ